MSDIEVLTSSVGEGSRDDEKDAKLVRRRLDDWRAREAGGPGDRPLPDGPMEPRTVAAIRPPIRFRRNRNHFHGLSGEAVVTLRARNATEGTYAGAVEKVLLPLFLGHLFQE